MSNHSGILRTINLVVTGCSVAIGMLCIQFSFLDARSVILGIYMILLATLLLLSDVFDVSVIQVQFLRYTIGRGAFYFSLHPWSLVRPH